MKTINGKTLGELLFNSAYHTSADPTAYMRGGKQHQKFWEEAANRFVQAIQSEGEDEQSNECPIYVPTESP